MLTAATTAMAQVDYTDKIANPSFEQNGLAGWTNNGYQSQTNDSPTGQGWKKDGTTYAEKWSASALADARLSQVVEGLPDGYYVVKADGHAYVDDTGTSATGAYLFAGRAQQTMGKGNTYQTGVIVTGGKVEIGVCNTRTNATWVAVDNFRLTAVDTTLTAYKSYLTTVRKAADVLKAEATRKDYFMPASLTEAITAADATGDDKAAIVAAVGQLETAIAEYRTIKPHYDCLLSAICGARNNVLRTSYDGKALLHQAIAHAVSTLATEGDTDKVDEETTALKQAMNDYLQNRPSEWVTIQNGKLWKTTTGATVQAHAPGFVRVGDLWYMVGEDRANSWNPDVNLYSSTDLVTWKFEKKIIQNGVTSPELGSSRMIERAKLMYNEKTAKFVVWCHWEASDYNASEAACFSCDSVNGAYQLEWSGRPLDIKSRDCNIYQDTDGKAYFISTTEENSHLGLFQLSDDYLGVTDHTRLFAWQGREAPAIVRLGQRYFMFSSACSGWDPNQCKLSYSSSLQNGWSDLKDVGNKIAYDTQAAAILEIKGTKQTTYLYVGDRWQDPDLPDTKTIMFPISFNGTSCKFEYHERLDINFVTGEWRETPTDKYFVDKTDWQVIDYSSQETSSENSPAKNAIDGNVDTKWHTQYSGNCASAPHYITIDMGRDHIIKGFLATPRMDGDTNGLIRKYQFLVSQDGKKWTIASSGDWLPYCTEMLFNKRTCRYVKLICKEGTYASLAELDIVIDPSEITAISLPSAPSEGKEVMRRECFSLDGRQIDNGMRGVYIERLLYNDGSSKSEKKIGR